MQIPSFIFGGGAPAKTPQEAARNRAVYEAIVSRMSNAPRDVGEGLQSVGNAFVARSMMDRASKGEEAGQARVAQLMGGLQDGADMGEIMSVLGDPWAMENPGTSAIAQALLQREMKQSDPMYQMDMERSQLELDAMRNPQAKPPDLQTLYDPETGLEFKGAWNPGTGEFDRVGGVKAPSGTTLSVDPATGTVNFSQGTGVKPLTEGQSKDTVFATRATGALPLIDEYGAALTDPVQHAMGVDPTGVVKGQQTPEFQQAWQAGREFLQAILRKDTGAAITPQETDEYGKVYLPQPGDGPEVLAQKRESRARAIAAIEAGMPPQAILARDKALVQTGAAATVPGGELPSGVSEEDIQYTMQVHGLSREEVLKRLKR